MKVISLVGARPQFIKEAVLQKELKKVGITEVLVHSGQHYNVHMSDVFFRVLNIKTPDYNLHVGSGSHARLTGKIMIAFEKIVAKERPDIIIVFGDTDTTLAGAIVGAKMGIKVAHVEAGIRMLPADMPEEINRKIVDRISSYLFCPTAGAVANLKKEGINKQVYCVGDIMYDLFLQTEKHVSNEICQKFNLADNSFILATIHRDYNVDFKKTLEKILKDLSLIARHKKIVFTLHPRTKKRIKEFGLKSYLKNIIVMEPLDYLSLRGVLAHAALVITDSGGLQKEAYFARKRALVLMPDTGWRELIANKWNILCSSSSLRRAVFHMPKAEYVPSLYGDGTSGEKIVKTLYKLYNDSL